MPSHPNELVAFLQASLFDGQSIVQETITDETGIALLRPTLGWDAKNFVMATYPIESPDYFGMVELAASNEEVVELKLVDAVRIVGKVMLNWVPYEGAVVKANSLFNPNMVRLPVSSWESTRTDIEGNYVIKAQLLGS